MEPTDWPTTTATRQLERIQDTGPRKFIYQPQTNNMRPTEPIQKDTSSMEHIYHPLTYGTSPISDSCLMTPASTLVQGTSTTTTLFTSSIEVPDDVIFFFFFLISYFL